MGNFIITSLEKLARRAQTASLTPLVVELSCCGMGIHTAAETSDAGMLPAEFAVSPRHADVLIIAGTVTLAMSRQIRRMYDQMPSPKYVVAFGNCPISGGPYWQYGYHVLKGIDQVIPVDVYIPGCPPGQAAFLEGIRNLREKITAGQKL